MPLTDVTDIEEKAIQLFRDFLNEQSVDNVLNSNELGQMGIDTHIGEPSPAQLERICKMTGKEWEASDWMVIPFMASNNLVDYNYRRWHIDCLAKMALTYMAKPLMFNHELWNVEDSEGFFFDVKLILGDEADEETRNGGEFGEENDEILEQEGYCWLFLCAAVPADSKAAEVIGRRKANDFSTGSLGSKPIYFCPDCEKEQGRPVSAFERDEEGEFVCRHLIPSRWSINYASLFGMKVERFSRYITFYCHNNEAMEGSIVGKGALPKAGVFREESIPKS